MAENKYGLRPTLAGRGYIGSRITQNKTVDITHFALGDGNGEAIVPAPEMEALVNEQYRAPISSMSDGSVPGELVFSMYVPVDVGGFVTREIGVFADDLLVAIASVVEMPRPLLAEGIAIAEELRAHLLLTEAEADRKSVV